MSILVLGGSRGIGRAIAVGLARPGVQVLINYRSMDSAAEEARQEVEAQGASAFLLRGDISSPEGAADVMARASRLTSRLDTLVHCTVKTIPGPILSADPDAFRDAVEVNAMSLLYAVQRAMPMLGAGSSVIFLSSRGARMALKNYASVGAPKAMAEALIRYMAVELAGIGARANVVSPTAQDTAAFRDIFPTDHAERLAAAARLSPSGRAVEARHIVDLVRFLASPAAEMIQGQVITLDGGSALAG